uniref:Uncharacterized protein n=1 Tax=Oryza brachyantha TaxID=4533 RepID=J3L0S3_ORYBR
MSLCGLDGIKLDLTGLLVRMNCSVPAPTVQLVAPLSPSWRIKFVLLIYRTQLEAASCPMSPVYQQQELRICRYSLVINAAINLK